MRSLFVSFPRSPIYHNRWVRQIKCIRSRHSIFHGDHPINEERCEAVREVPKALLLWKLKCFLFGTERESRTVARQSFTILLLLCKLKHFPFGQSCVHDSLKSAWQSWECMTVFNAWKFWVHDSLESMTVLSAWQSWVHDSLTVSLSHSLTVSQSHSLTVSQSHSLTVS